MKTKEIWIVAYIYSIICFCIFFTMKEIEHKKLYKDLYQAKSIAVEYHDISESLYNAVDSLNLHIDKMDRLDKLIQDLATVPRDRQSLILSTCFNETNLKYNVGEHKGKTNKGVYGICGVNLEIWEKEIPELNKDNIDSLYAGHLVLSYLLNEENGNLFNSLKRYKGSELNIFPVIHTLELKRLIKI